MKLRTLAAKPKETEPVAATAGVGAIPRRGCAVAPLSFAQQRLWFLEALEPGSPRFSIMTAVHLCGRLDRGIFRRSINEIVRRHEILRTVFREQDGTPAQR